MTFCNSKYHLLAIVSTCPCPAPVSALSPPCSTDLQLVVVHAVCMGGVELGVVGHVQQLNDQVTGQQLCHKWMLEEQVTSCWKITTLDTNRKLF